MIAHEVARLSLRELAEQERQQQDEPDTLERSEVEWRRLASGQE